MIGVLVSGTGTNLQALIDEGLPIAAVASNKSGVRALERAEAARIPAAVFELEAYPTREQRDLAMADWLESHGTRVVVCAGFTHLLEPAFLQRFPHRVINVHPSFLPAFPGLHAARDALAAGATETGVTVFEVDDDVDAGPILAQERVPILPNDSVDTLLERLHGVEHRLLPRVARDLLTAE